MTQNRGAEAQTVLRLHNITKRFGPLTANDAISFDLKRGEIIALLGENGAGKTTLMNIIFGHYVADDGYVEIGGSRLPPGDPAAALRQGIGMVHQHFTLADQMTVLENIALGTQSLFAPRLDRHVAVERIRHLATSFGLAINPDATVADLSVGERQRVEILKALYRNADILILDEPTAVLTPIETEALFATLKKLVAAGLSVIFISHKMKEVIAISDRVIVLRGGRIAGERVTDQTDANELADLMVGTSIVQPERVDHEPGGAVMSMRGVSASGATGGSALVDINLDLLAGTITGIAGVSGNGQAAIAEIIAGVRSPDSGALKFNGAAPTDWSARKALEIGVARIPEDRHATGMIGDMTITENMISEAYRSSRFSKGVLLNWRAAQDFAAAAIDTYQVKCPGPDATVRLLSGGNMQKLILARALDGEPRVILAHQPTRGLDVGSVAYVHARLLEARERGAAILLISEDLDEVLALSDRIAIMSAGRISEPFARGTKTVRQIGQMMAGHVSGTATSKEEHAA